MEKSRAAAPSSPRSLRRTQVQPSASTAQIGSTSLLLLALSTPCGSISRRSLPPQTRLRSCLPSMPRSIPCRMHQRNYWGSAPPPQALPRPASRVPRPPRSHPYLAAASGRYRKVRVSSRGIGTKDGQVPYPFRDLSVFTAHLLPLLKKMSSMFLSPVC